MKQCVYVCARTPTYILRYMQCTNTHALSCIHTLIIRKLYIIYLCIVCMHVHMHACFRTQDLRGLPTGLRREDPLPTDLARVQGCFQALLLEVDFCFKGLGFRFREV